MARIFVWRRKQLIWRSHGPAQRGWKTHDAMPSRLARKRGKEDDVLYHELYRDYEGGELPPWGNEWFERILADLRELYSRIQEGRRPTLREKLRKDIAVLHRLGFWPGDLTDEEWADRLLAELRTYQRAKQDFEGVLADPKSTKRL